MIIPEGASKKSLLKPQAHDPTQAGENAAFPPPYQAYESPILQQTPPKAPGTPAGKRFLRAFAVALVIWTLTAALFHSIIRVAHLSRHAPSHPFPHHPRPITPPPANMSFAECRDWAYANGHSRHRGAPYTSIISFDLPASSDAFFVLSVSHKIGGHIRVQPSPDPQAQFVRVDVEVDYYREEIRDMTHICLLKARENENGVGIFTDEPWPPLHRKEDSLSFRITVSIPPIAIPSFETDLPNFTHLIGGFPPEVSFGDLSLKSTNSIISASVKTNKAFVYTTNGAIKGEFSVDQELSLQTTNAPVEVAVHLHNDANPSQNTTLDMKTTNGRISARTWLTTRDENAQKGGSYEIRARTTNSPADVKVASAPFDSSLWMSAQSTNGPVSVTTHPTFEGSFELQSTIFRPRVEVLNTNNDPAGRGRTRYLDLRYVRPNKARGSTYWSDGRGAPNLKGAIQIETTNSAANLIVL